MNTTEASDLMVAIKPSLDALYDEGYRAGMEAAARICDGYTFDEIATGKVDHNERAWCDFCAAAIRAAMGG